MRWPRNFESTARNLESTTYVRRPESRSAGTVEFGATFVSSLLHVGTFNVRSGEPHGTYASAIDRDALATLGVNMIEVYRSRSFSHSLMFTQAGTFGFHCVPSSPAPS